MGRLLLLLAFLLPGTLAAQDGASEVNRVLVLLKEGKRGGTQETFTLTQPQLNAFAMAALQGKEHLGVQSLQVDLKGGGGFLARALIDMDKVELSGLTVRMFKALLSGTQTLETEGTFEGKEGRGHLKLEKASINGVWVPVTLVEGIVSYLTRNRPPHIDITEPFDLPYGIREIRLETGLVRIIR